MKFRALLLALALGLGLASTAEAGTTREEAVKNADTDNNGRLDGKEAKYLKKNHPKMYANLMGFCEDAKEHPKKNGVDLPAEPTKKQKQCKKKHIAKPFLRAWVDQKKDGNDD
jgi:hypothetical protein